MKVCEITALLEQLAPLRYACDWDNPGLRAGDPEAEVHHVFLGFDGDLAAVREAAEAGADLLVTHHPLLFQAEKDLSADSLAGQKIMTLFSHGMAAYGMHTHFDAAPGCMADMAADRLGLQDRRYLFPQDDGGIGIAGELPEAVTPEDFCRRVKEAFSLSYILLYDRGDAGRKIRRVAVLPGAGGHDAGEALAAGAELYLTGDMTHHAILDAMDQGLAVADAGHYGLEWIFLEKVEKYLRDVLPDDIELTVQKRHFPGRAL